MQMMSSSRGVQFNLNCDRESAARLIQKNYKAIKANRVSAECAQSSIVSWANVHSVESPLPLVQSALGLIESTNESLLSAISLTPREPFKSQEDFNSAVFTDCTLIDFFDFFDKYKAASDANPDHSVKTLMSEIYYGSIDVNDFYHDPDLKQKINSAANWLGIRNSGFVHIFRSSTSIDEVKSKLLFEKNYCLMQEVIKNFLLLEN